jgi:hypothetical protein
MRPATTTNNIAGGSSDARLAHCTSQLTLTPLASCAPGIRHSVLFLDSFPILR